MNNQNTLSTANIEDIEIVLKRVYESKGQICKILQETYMPIDPSLLHENITAECESIVNTATTTATNAESDDTLDLDAFEAIFNQMDELDKALSVPKSSSNLNITKTGPKSLRHGSMLGQTGLVNVTLQPGLLRGANGTMMHNSTFCLNTTFAQPEPMDMGNLVRVTNEMVNKFNSIKIVSMEELQKKNISTAIRSILTSFTASINKLNAFFEKIKNHGNKSNGEQQVTQVANLNAEFCNNLRELSDSLKDIRSIEDKKEVFSITENMPELILPLSDDLMEIIQKYSYGQ